MRLLVLVALLLPPFAHASEADFSGAWVAWLCPSGVQQDSGKCSNFVLELHQQGDKICGAHFFATAGAAEIDEGAAPSVIGDIVNGTATMAVISSRASPPVRVPAKLKKANGKLQWARLEDPPGDYLLPRSTTLVRSKKKTLFAPLFEQQLKAACSSAFVMATQGVPQQEPIKQQKE